jgi:hypothetical protein
MGRFVELVLEAECALVFGIFVGSIQSFLGCHRIFSKSKPFFLSKLNPFIENLEMKIPEIVIDENSIFLGLPESWIWIVGFRPKIELQLPKIQNPNPNFRRPDFFVILFRKVPCKSWKLEFETAERRTTVTF